MECERGDMRLSLNSREPESMRKESKTDREALARERSMNYNRNISNKAEAVAVNVEPAPALPKSRRRQ